MNYQKALDEELKTIAAREKKPRLLLHSCCGPCSSYVLEYLTRFFSVSVFYYNPNIAPEAEYQKRLSEQKRLLKEMAANGPVELMEVPYDHGEFLEAAAGLEAEREGGARCERCFILRLEETARTAARLDFDYFTTTLSVSPHKNAQLLNRVGGEMAEKYGVRYLYSDFKKRDGYKRSLELSARYGLYRQDWCGCEYSKSED